MANSYFVGGYGTDSYKSITSATATEYTSAADALTAIQAATDSTFGVAAKNGDLTLGAETDDKLVLHVSPASADDVLAATPTSSTVTVTSSFAGQLWFTHIGVDDGLSVGGAVTSTTPETSLYKLVIDGADTTQGGKEGDRIYVFNSGFLDVKNGGKIDGKNGLYFQGNASVSGEGSVLSGALLSLYGCEVGISVTLDVKDGGKLYFGYDAQTSNIGHSSKAGRAGTLNIAGGIVDANVNMVVNAGGNIKITNSTDDEKTYYGSLKVKSLDLSKNTDSRLNITLNSADYEGLTTSYKLVEITDSAKTLDSSKISITVDGAAYTLGTTFADCYSINQVDNDLVLTYTPPPPIKVTNPDSSTQNFDSLLTANGFAQDGAVVEFVTSSFTDATVVAANSSLVLDKDITFKGKTTATFGITGSGYLMFGNTTTKKAINVTVAEGSDITFGGLGTGLNFRYGEDSGKKVASTLTVDNARLATSYAISSNGLVTVKGAGVKGTYGIGEATADTLDAKYLVANLASKNNITVKDRFDNYADDVALRLTDYAYVVAVNGITIGSEDGTITSIVSVENSKIEFINSSENSSCAFRFTQAHGNKLQISGDSEVLVREFDFAKEGIITIDGADAYVRVAKITVADGASATLNVTLTTEQLAAQSLELGVNTAIFEISGSGDNLLDTTVMLDGAAYTLGDEIVDDAGNKYVINMGDANGDSVENDLVMTLTEKAPEPVIPEDPVVPEGPGGEGSEGGMEIAAQNPPVFINPKYSEKSTGKKVNGVELEYGVNAFSSIEDAKAALGADAAVSMVVSKSAKFDSESDLSGISEIAGNSPVEKIRKTSATIKSTPKKSLTLNGTTAAATGFRQFAKVKVLNGANIGGDIINEKYTVKFKGTLDANGEWQDGVATTTNAAAGTLKATDSTIANAFGFKSVKLTNSQAGILGVNPVAKDVATIKGGAVASTEIVKEKRVGSVTAKNSIVDSVMDYKTLKLQGESAVASIVNVQNVTVSGKADVQINDLTDTAILNNKLTIGSKAIVDLGIGNFGAGNDKMTIGSKATVYADSLDFGEGKDSLKISGTLVLENGMLEGIEKISGRGEIATTAAYADALDERFDDIFGGEILDLGNTVANFRGTKNELADNTEKKALKWNSAEGELGGWLGIGDDVDCIDSVDFVKITASKDGTLEISSADWSGSSDIVTLDGVKLDISGGSASFGITAGEDYLLKVERKDSNSMSYDIKLA